MPLQKPSRRASCRLQASQPRGKFPISRPKASLSPNCNTSIAPLQILKLLSFYFALLSRSVNLQILTQPKLIFKMGVLSHKKMGRFTLSPVLVPFPKTHAKQPPKDSVQHIQALPPDKRVKVTPLSQLKDNDRVEQSEPKVFLNFIIRGVKTLMLAVVKINCSIVGKKG